MTRRGAMRSRPLLELAGQIVPGAAIEVLFTEPAREARVGHDRVEVVHQIGLGHHRQVDDVALGHRADVETLEPPAM
jgi:hypothetical protein